MPPPESDARSVDRHIDAQGSTGARARASGGPDRLVARLAESQHGVVARAQLTDLGISRDRIDGRVRRGQLCVVHRGVYAAGHGLLGRDGRWMAAVLASGNRALLSHRSAGVAWGLLGSRGGPIEVTRPIGWRAPRGIVAHRAPVPEDEVAAVDGIPATGVSRTLLDLAATLSRGRLERALDEAEVRGLTDRVSVPALLERYPRRPGTAALRSILGEESRARGITRSELEERFAALVASAGVPPPRFNAALTVRGRFLEVDCIWPMARLVVELDGRAVHGTARAFEGDRARDRLLIADGWRVMRVTWRALRDEPERVLAELGETLARGGETLARGARPTL